MKKSILVSGIAGSGKTSVCKQLDAMGYEAYGIEDVEGMFAMYRKGTRELFTDYDNSDPEKIKNADWLCDVSKLKELMNKQNEDTAFYCGVASNMDDLIPLFDKFTILSVSPRILHKRLSTREGTDDIGNTEESRKTVLGWKDWWEETMRDKGAIVVDAHGSMQEVAKSVVAITNEAMSRGQNH